MACLRTWSARLAWLAGAVAVSIPVAALYHCWSILPGDWGRQLGVPSQPWSAPDGATRVGLVVLASIPSALWALALLALRRALISFSAGDLFGSRVHECLRRFATYAFASATLGLVNPSLLVLLWSVMQGPGEATLLIHVNPTHFSTMIVASVMWIFSKVLEQARLLERENSSFV